ncbi:MAG: lipid-binding SYLF domain-containing protein [Prochlorococcus marinus CUG1438]|nr:lipid-binding SYLF domain-containing protein [Prochlorococcus marinus CUG1438]
MNLKIIRESILIAVLIFPQYLVSVKSSHLNKFEFNDISDQLLISGWNPSSDKNRKDKKASDKTLRALNKFKKISSLKPYFKKARGFAVFPNVGKGGIGIGGARGKGEVFEKGDVIGSTTLTQVSIGFQLGGQAFSQIIFFKDKKSLERFTEGNFEFGASASAALISEGAIASADYSDGVAVLTFSKGGLMYEASIGGQKFSFEEY